MSLPIPHAFPVELDGWSVIKSSEAEWRPGQRGYVVWLEKVMDDGTVLRFESTIHDPQTELPMLVPILRALCQMSAPDLRLSVTRTKATRFALRRHDKARKLIR